jgi:hypothetical protein
MDNANWIDVWFWCFAASVAIGLVWSIARELHIRTISRESKAIQENQAVANQVLHQVSEKIDKSDDATKERFADIKQLILDIEKRQRDAEIMRALQQRGSTNHIHGDNTRIAQGGDVDQR